MFIEVIIPLALPKNYTWAVPLAMQSGIQPGVRVEVTLGNKKYAGIVKQILQNKPAAFEPKEILNVLDNEPLLHPQQLELWQWIAEYYMCTEGEVMQAAIPANLKLSSESVLIWNETAEYEPSDLNDAEYMVTEALEMKKELRLSEVQQLLDSNRVYPVIRKLIDKNICYVWEELKEKYKVKTETYITLHPDYHQEENLAELLNNWTSRAAKQLELLLAYLHLVKAEGEVIKAELLKKSGATDAQLKALTDKKILVAQKRAKDRIVSLPKDLNIRFELSPAQEIALGEINARFEDKNVCLLHGVTASGKTQLYIKLIEAHIASGKQVLYMLPEIALTAQMIRRLQQHFGSQIAIYHSKFNPNERVEIWHKVKSGEIKAVLGARSSLFLPFRQLGFIIIDEEHDASYKQQEPAPRYHARDAAVYYASLFGARVLLGSATPSIESYYNCVRGKYGLVTLSERFGNAALPEIRLVDLTPLQTKGKLAFSPALLQEISDSLVNKKQVILFQNRRGYAPYQICNTCGWIPHCKQCDVTLTYHKSKNKLACHYCGTVYPVIQTCTACGSHNFIQKNFGTEQIEELLTEKFPDAKVARMDYDSIKGKNDHDALIKRFEEQRIDILVGTQMVVKGLDFIHVNLVGIIDADGILNFTDFRVNERAYQLMEQVSGRAGRKDADGKVLIQVSNVHHPVLQFVKAHDYTSLFHAELNNRRQFGYPPFTRLIRVIFRHKEKHLAEEAANLMMQGMKAGFAQEMNGPAQPVVDRVRNQHIWEILIKLPKNSNRIIQCKREIAQQIVIIQSNKRYRSVMILPDVDPV
ncbi:replication restart helicase PriA [Sediminibacterium ginsengisoli]|uniref:Replication restart protein PriA n=1 Tax=Sediminibacterium ginsengisoli TaxID=413434 RepID=A0A1T4L4D1_9BACT|nr:primosomal protein N' [Sediminibacterium ginsengisoli]SJZ49503.1 replication restart DNA helicase PriA [Sediminibacterium ginsengisoli]